MNDNSDGHRDPFASSPEHARERVRLEIAISSLTGRRLTGFVESDEQTLKTLGYNNEAEFWEALLSKPMKASSFIDLIRRLHVDHRGTSTYFVEVALGRLLRMALQTQEPWINIDPTASTPPKSESEHWRVKNPRRAVEWIVSMPSERGLIPVELRDYLEPPRPANASETVGEANRPVETLARPRGRRPSARDRVVREMVDAVQSGAMTRDGLANSPEKVIAARFSASRDTCRAARSIALSEIVEN